MTRAMSLAMVAALAGVIALEAVAAADDTGRSFVGSVQLDYLDIPTESTGRTIALDGATTELSLKMTQDLGEHLTSSVKICVACHGLEVAMASFDLRVADELNFRVGRFTPAFGEFPQRYDPANHPTSDKPLPYDMGRMLHRTDWNEGILPAPWVDNGLEVDGTHFFDEDAQIDYAAYAVAGPRSDAIHPTDFDFVESHSSYYVDNNSQPTVGAWLSYNQTLGDLRTTAGGSVMTGTYDPLARLGFLICGVHGVARYQGFTLRGEYLWRQTDMDPEAALQYTPRDHRLPTSWELAIDQNGHSFVKQGFYLELELPLTERFDGVVRWDGLRRVGNVPLDSTLTPDAGMLRYTVGAAIKIYKDLRLKISGERYKFRDYPDETAIHVGVAGPF